jgi:hypothetical protein
MHQDARTFNEQAWKHLETLSRAVVGGHQHNVMTTAELERIKDEGVVAAFKADGCLFSHLAMHNRQANG